DGSKIAVVSAPEDKVVSFEGKSDIQIVNVADGSVTTLPDKLWRADAPSKYGRVNSLSWSNDGKLLAFVILFDGYPSEIILADWQAAGVVTTKLARPDNISFQVSVDGAFKILWRKGSAEMCVIGQEKARNRLYSVTEFQGAGAASFKCLTPGDV